MLLAALFSSTTIAEPNRFELGDVGRIIRVFDPQLSPDGKSIVFVLSKPNLKDARYDRSLILVDVATGAQRTLIQDRKNVALPRWSPSGDRIAFLAAAAARAGSDSAAGPKVPVQQIFMLRMDGGDASPITSVAHDVEHFAWSPDGKQLAFAMADDNPAQKEIDQHNDAFEVGDNDYRATEATMPAHAWLLSAEEGPARRLTSGAWSLPRSAPAGAPASPFSWSPNGKSIAIVQQVSPTWGASDQSVVALVDIASGQISKPTAHKAFETNPQYSPDGAQIAYAYYRDGGRLAVSDIFVAPASGGDGINITRTLDRNIVRAVWMPDGKSLLIAGHDGTHVALWVQPSSGAARKLDLGDIDPAWLFWVDLSMSHDGALTFVGTTPTHPDEIYYLSAASAAPRRLTDFNHEVASRDFGRMETLSWSGPNGFKEDGVLVYPLGFSHERKYPLVLLIHGGPPAASTLSFGALPHLLAARGYVVFQPNYRGSDNLGHAYQRAIFNDAGDGPGRDVMAGLTALEKRGFIDSSRIAVSGWSYGGYMTSWLTGHYQVWKAAVEGAALNALIDHYSLSDFRAFGPELFGGSPWTGNLMKAYVAQSPITYAARIRTPTLILADTGDPRVPIGQSYLMYHALKDNGVHVRFFAYPVQSHFPADPVRITDVYRRWIEWIDQYLK